MDGFEGARPRFFSAAPSALPRFHTELMQGFHFDMMFSPANYERQGMHKIQTNWLTVGGIPRAGEHHNTHIVARMVMVGVRP